MADAGAGDAAVAARVLRQILLLHVRRVVELGCGEDVGGDATESRGRERALVDLTRGLRRPLLDVRRAEDRGAVARIGRLPLRRVVAFPEEAEHRLEARLARVVDHAHDLGVSGPTRGHLLVARVRRAAAGVADRSREDAGGLPE